MKSDYGYLMRGVRFAPGAHTVEFIFQPPTKALKLSLAAIALALTLLGGLILVRPKNAVSLEPSAAPANNKAAK